MSMVAVRIEATVPKGIKDDLRDLAEEDAAADGARASMSRTLCRLVKQEKVRRKERRREEGAA